MPYSQLMVIGRGHLWVPYDALKCLLQYLMCQKLLVFYATLQHGSVLCKVVIFFLRNESQRHDSIQIPTLCWDRCLPGTWPANLYGQIVQSSRIQRFKKLLCLQTCKCSSLLKAFVICLLTDNIFSVWKPGFPGLLTGWCASGKSIKILWSPLLVIC